MASKTANVLARVEPSVKEQAESIMSQLGIPVSVVINMLYKQIILTKSIPFSLALPSRPLCREGMDGEAFEAMIMKGYEQSKAGLARPMDEVFDEILRRIEE